jgi:twitching motility two-component system response regulator PilH
MQHPQRILMVVDDYDVLLSSAIVARIEGHQLKSLPECLKVEKLLEVGIAFRPELIFLDLDMKGIAEMDPIKVLKAQACLKGVPVIYLSDRDDIVQLSKESGADGYFKKPLKIDGLTEIMETYLDRV